jgi:hypothetical protein
VVVNASHIGRMTVVAHNELNGHAAVLPTLTGIVWRSSAASAAVSR